MKSLKTLTLAALVFLAGTTLAAAPNFVFIFTDDQRFDSFGTMGNPDVQTPNMDRLIEGGTLFNQAYIQGSMVTATCLPSRAMLMSGKSIFRAPMQLDSGLLLPQALKQGGYHCYAAGKWHNGVESFLASFDEAEAIFFGGASGTHTNVRLNYLENGAMEPYQVPGVDATVLFADAAVRFLKRQQDQERPFFCYLPFTAPHSPYTAPEKYAAMYDGKQLALPPNVNRQSRQGESQPQRRGRGGRDPSQRLPGYYAMITHLDNEIGRVMKAIDDYGHRDDTIIVFATDHGFSMGSHGENGKANGYEHGCRSIISFAGPGIPRGKRTNDLAYLLDIYPTLCDLAGLPIPADPEGISLASSIRGIDGPRRETLFTAFFNRDRTIRNERWKLFTRLDLNEQQLFDLKNDPHELNNLANRPEHAATIAQLQAALDKARQQAGETPDRVREQMQRRGGRRSRGTR